MEDTTMGKKVMPILKTEAYIAANKERLDMSVLVASKGKELTEADKSAATIKLNDALETLNNEVKSANYAKLLLSETPVLNAIKTGKFDLYRIVFDDDAKEYVFTNREYVISLLEMADEATTNIFENAQWKFWAEAFNHAIYTMRMKKLDVPVDKISKRLSKSKISEVARKLNIGDITTITGATKVVQALFDAVHFEELTDDKGNVVKKNGKNINKFKALTKDTHALLDNYSKWSGGTLGDIIFPSDKTFHVQLMHVFHRIVTGSDYGADRG
jgi:hypothetical protein